MNPETYQERVILAASFREKPNIQTPNEIFNLSTTVLPFLNLSDFPLHEPFPWKTQTRLESIRSKAQRHSPLHTIRDIRAFGIR